jgi:hypothetical protein
MQIKVTGRDDTKKDKDGVGQERSLSLEFDFGKDLADMTSKFTDDVVFHNARANMVVGVQSHARGRIKAGKSNQEVVAAFSGPKAYKPGIRKSTPPHERLAKDIEKLTPEQRRELIASIGKD